MNIEQYKIEIQRTWQDDMSQREQLCNAALGLVGEVGEFERDRVMTELGDVAYYTYTLARLLEISPEAERVTRSTPSLLTAAARVAEGVKKITFHAPDGAKKDRIVAGLCEDLGIIVSRIHYYASRSATDRYFLGEVLQGNIYKLRARYPDGFTAGGGIR